MQKSGFLYTCDRCGTTDFVELGCVNSNMSADQVLYTRGWSALDNDQDLCPVCTAEYKRFMDAFLKKPEDPKEDEVKE